MEIQILEKTYIQPNPYFSMFQKSSQENSKIIEYYLRDHVEFDFDEIEIVNNRPMNIWLYALCRKYVEGSDEASDNQAEVEVKGEYGDNPTEK